MRPGIITAETRWPSFPSRQMARAIATQWCLCPESIPRDDNVSGVRLPAVVNEGRWVVQCPCGGAQVASEQDRRMFCCECLNMYAGGKWVLVDWPANRTAIEDILLLRPFPQNRNWSPGESQFDLLIENMLNAVSSFERIP